MGLITACILNLLFIKRWGQKSFYVSVDMWDSGSLFLSWVLAGLTDNIDDGTTARKHFWRWVLAQGFAFLQLCVSYLRAGIASYWISSCSLLEIDAPSRSQLLLPRCQPAGSASFLEQYYWLDRQESLSRTKWGCQGALGQQPGWRQNCQIGRSRGVSVGISGRNHITLRAIHSHCCRNGEKPVYTHVVSWLKLMKVALDWLESTGVVMREAREVTRAPRSALRSTPPSVDIRLPVLSSADTVLLLRIYRTAGSGTDRRLRAPIETPPFTRCTCITEIIFVRKRFTNDFDSRSQVGNGTVWTKNSTQTHIISTKMTAIYDPQIKKSGLIKRRVVNWNWATFRLNPKRELEWNLEPESARVFSSVEKGSPAAPLTHKDFRLQSASLSAQMSQPALTPSCLHTCLCKSWPVWSFANSFPLLASGQLSLKTALPAPSLCENQTCSGLVVG